MAATDVTILVVDDDADLRSALTEYISKMGVKVRKAGSVAEAERLIQSEPTPFDLVLTDLKIPGGSGMDVLRAAHSRSQESLVSIITGYASIETAIEAIRLGAYNYITKPFSLNELGVQVRNMIERVTLSKENARLSIRLQELYRQVNKAESDRVDALRLQEEIRNHLQENGRKLDRLIAFHSAKQAAQGVNREKPAVSMFMQAVERLEKLRESTGMSRLELEEKKRDLIEQFVNDF